MNSANADYLRDRESEMLAFLKDLVLTQSGTRHKAGVDRVGRLIGQTLSPLAQTAGNRALFEVVSTQAEALGFSVMEAYR